MSKENNSAERDDMKSSGFYNEIGEFVRYDEDDMEILQSCHDAESILAAIDEIRNRHRKIYFRMKGDVKDKMATSKPYKPAVDRFIDSQTIGCLLDADSDFGNICNEIKMLHAKKNADYGNAFSKNYGRYGINYSLMHLDEKLDRIKSICDNGNMLDGEGLEDSLIDLACYGLMTVIEIRNRNKQAV